MRIRAAAAACACCLALQAAAISPGDFVRAALAHSTEYETAQAQLEAAKQGKLVARSALLPQLRGSAGRRLIPRESEPRGGGPPEANKFQLAASLTQTLFSLEQSRTLEQAGLLEEAAEHQLRAIGQQIVIGAYRAYLNAALAKASLHALAERQLTVEQQLLIAESNFEFGRGDTTLVDELSVRAQLAEIDAERAEAERQLEAAMLVLAQLAGTRPGRLEELSGSIPNLEGEDWPERAVAAGLEVRASEASLRAQIVGEEVQRAAILPTAELSATYSAREDETIDLNFSIPLYSSGGATAAALRASAQTRSSSLALEAARRQARLDADDALLQIRTQDERIRLLIKTRDAQLARLAAATELSAEGVGIAFQVIDAAADVAAAEVAIVAARHDKLAAVLALRASVGELDVAAAAAYDTLFAR